MKKIYIDSDYRCHASNPDGKYREAEVPFFDDKCDAYIEGYRYVPEGETWTRKDGEAFTGEMIAPAVDYSLLGIAQDQYAHDMAEAAMSYQEGVNSV